MPPTTLFALAGHTPLPPNLSRSALILVDCQNEYVEGPLALPDVAPAIARAAELLAAIRQAGGRVIHVAHRGAPGGLFDRGQKRGAIIETVAPQEGEAVVEKPRPNAFSGTDLQARIGEPAMPLIFAGFMTHMCVSSTVRAALDLGFASTVAADACATRPLPTAAGAVSAQTLHEAELAALADRFAGVFPVSALVR